MKYLFFAIWDRMTGRNKLDEVKGRPQMGIVRTEDGFFLSIDGELEKVELSVVATTIEEVEASIRHREYEEARRLQSRWHRFVEVPWHRFVAVPLGWLFFWVPILDRKMVALAEKRWRRQSNTRVFTVPPKDNSRKP